MKIILLLALSLLSFAAFHASEPVRQSVAFVVNDVKPWLTITSKQPGKHWADGWKAEDVKMMSANEPVITPEGNSWIITFKP